MKYAIDKIVGDVVVLENIDTGEIIELLINALPNEVCEGSIIKKENDMYVLDEDTESMRRRMLRERIEKLKQNKEVL